jgi:two-component system phosphate regulon response regulator PhoB
MNRDRTGGRTVLMVDDDAALCVVLRYNLEKEGYRVVEASDGVKALFAAGETLPDLIILDWMLPSMSGDEVCRNLRRNADTRNVPIIMLTARSGDSDRARALELGATDYITKPFSMAALLARIDELTQKDIAP